MPRLVPVVLVASLPFVLLGFPEADAAAPPVKAPCDRFGDPLPDGAIARLGTSRLRTANDVEALALGTDGREVLTFEGRGTLTAWDVATGRRLSQDRIAPRFAAAFSPDRRLLVGAHTGPRHGLWPEAMPATEPAGRQRLVLWDVAAGTSLRQLARDTAPGQAVSFSPDGKFVVSAACDGTVRTWDAGTGEQIGRFSVTRTMFGWAAINDPVLLAGGKTALVVLSPNKYDRTPKSGLRVYDVA